MFKKILTKIKSRSVLIIFLIFTIILFPISLTNSPETDVKAIITGVGLDVSDEGQIELSSMMLIPVYSPSFKENRKVITVKADNLGLCFEKLALHLGRRVGLAHCGIVVIGEEFSQRDIIKELDYLFRGKRVSQNPIIVATANAKELLEESSKIDKSYSMTLENIVRYNDLASNSYKNDLETLLVDYHSPHRVSIIPVVEITNDETLGLKVEDIASSSSGQSSTEGGESSSSGGESSGGEQKVVSNDGKSIIIDKGTMVDELSTEDVKKLNWLNAGAALNMEALENINYEYYKNATISIFIKDKKISYKLGFKNKKPQVMYSMVVGCALEYVNSEDDQYLFLDRNHNFITQAVKDALTNRIKSDIAQTIVRIKADNLDLLNWYEKFYKFKTKEFKEYLQTLPSVDDYLEHVNVYVNVKILARG